MKLFGQIIRTAVNVTLLPVAIAKDILTLGGVALDERSATIKAIERLKEEASEEQD